jgi:hypothetical protein
MHACISFEALGLSLDSLSLLIDFLKWIAKTLASMFGYQLSEFEQSIGAVFVLSFGIFCGSLMIQTFYVLS